MSRGVGAVRLAQEFVPEQSLTLFVLVTELGNRALIIYILLILLLVDKKRRRELSILLGVVMSGFILHHTLKSVIGLPRPSESYQIIEQIGSGFPSGHAFQSTTFYGGAAYILSYGRKWQRYSFAILLISLVSISRIVLGVHYFADIAVGFVLGLIYVPVYSKAH